MHLSKEHFRHAFPSRATFAELCERLGLDLTVLLFIPLFDSLVSLLILWVELDNARVSDVEAFTAIV